MKAVFTKETILNFIQHKEGFSQETCGCNLIIVQDFNLQFFVNDLKIRCEFLLCIKKFYSWFNEEEFQYHMKTCVSHPLVQNKVEKLWVLQRAKQNISAKKSTQNSINFTQILKKMDYNVRVDSQYLHHLQDVKEQPTDEEEIGFKGYIDKLKDREAQDQFNNFSVQEFLVTTDDLLILNDVQKWQRYPNRSKNVHTTRADIGISSLSKVSKSCQQTDAHTNVNMRGFVESFGDIVEGRVLMKAANPNTRQTSDSDDALLPQRFKILRSSTSHKQIRNGIPLSLGTQENSNDERENCRLKKLSAESACTLSTFVAEDKQDLYGFKKYLTLQFYGRKTRNVSAQNYGITRASQQMSKENSQEIKSSCLDVLATGIHKGTNMLDLESESKEVLPIAKSHISEEFVYSCGKRNSSENLENISDTLPPTNKISTLVPPLDNMEVNDALNSTTKTNLLVKHPSSTTQLPTVTEAESPNGKTEHEQQNSHFICASRSFPAFKNAGVQDLCRQTESRKKIETKLFNFSDSLRQGNQLLLFRLPNDLDQTIGGFFSKHQK